MANHYAIVAAIFYSELAEKLEQGARSALTEWGIGDDLIDRFEVPGAFELPVVAMACAKKGTYAGVICLGAVIRGETDHYDYVCSEAAHGIQEVGLRTGTPCSFGVLTCDTIEQALARTGAGKRDQGYNAAKAVLVSAQQLESMQRSSSE